MRDSGVCVVFPHEQNMSWSYPLNSISFNLEDMPVILHVCSTAYVPVAQAITQPSCLVIWIEFGGPEFNPRVGPSSVMLKGI